MRKMIQKTLALLLTAALLLPTAFASFAFAADADLPIVCVCGETEIFAVNENGERYAPKAEFSEQLVNEAVPELIPVFAKAVATNNYTEWSEKALEAIAPIYEPIQPRPDGSLPENTGINWSWSPAAVTPADPRFNFYEYWWDFRLSPLEVADDLRAYLQCVTERTGQEKVVLESRCAGTAVAAAYQKMAQA